MNLMDLLGDRGSVLEVVELFLVECISTYF